VSEKFAKREDPCYAPLRPLPSSALDQHLTLSEARNFTGKSETTLKRLIREITGELNHPDRAFLLPSPEEIERRRAAKEPYAWKIDRQLLLRRFPPETPAGHGSGGGASQESVSAPPELMLQVLREQLQSKDQQIRTLETQLDRKDEQIGSLNERMRESNVLMRELQQRLAIAPPKPPAPDTVLDSRPPPPVSERRGAATPKPATDKPSAGSAKSAPPPKPKPVHPPSTPPLKKKATKPQRGFFRRLFRSSK
jgi:hypothetical protein